MPSFSIPNIRITGIVTSIPSDTENNMDLPTISPEEKKVLINKTGINTRFLAPAHISAVDLCLSAAEDLFLQSEFDPQSIGIVVFVTQTPDYPLPGNSMIIHKRLNLPNAALLFDVHQGCAGYVYGLSLISGLMNAMNIEYGLLLAGDTLSHLLSATDRTTRPIFSDAGSATLLCRDRDAKPIHFNIGADGKGFDTIHIKDGGARNPFNINSLRVKIEHPGIERAGVHLVMEGIDVMNYALKYVVPNVQCSLQIPGWDSESIDYFVFHQANKILNESLRRQLCLPPDKVPESLSAFGNTSCCTIPVTIAHCLEKQLQEKPLKLLLCGFGAGFSWGTALVETKPGMICPQPKQTTIPYGR